MTATQRKKNRGERKKGVVLLIIVTLLTLFIMIGITLSLVAINYRESGEKIRAAGTYGDHPEREMELALGQILYGNQLVTSLSPHNLLGDLYGHDGVAGTVTQYAEENGGQVIRITYQQAASQPFSNAAFSDLPHYYAGRVITFTDGDAAGYSTRVMAYIPTPNNATTGTLYVEAIESDLPVKVLPSNGSRFLINGAPFNGTGFGYSTTTYNIDMDENGADIAPGDPRRVALVGNFAAMQNIPQFQQGGPDEGWDAADLNNWHLAVVPPGLGVTQTLPIIPSFGRPELVNYWLYQINPSGGNINQIPIDRLRKISLRPIGAEYAGGASQSDHPNFNGSNPNYHPINGPWDVDNDGDGIADSIWVDPGLPVVTAKDGRKYKRLFAFLIQDLDGRINVNVHGNLLQVANAAFRAEQATTGPLGLAPSGSYLPRGMCYGTAEVDFLSVFGNFNNAQDRAAYQAVLTLRYGNDGLPGAANTRDGFSVVKHHGTPNDYLNQFSWYTSPPDVWGRGALALDASGNPTTAFMGQTGEMLDNPYEIHVGTYAQPTDAPYTPAEIEALLRYHDPGAATLSTRLINAQTQNHLALSSRGDLFGGSSPPGSEHRRRQVLAGMGRHVPVPMARVPREMYTVDPMNPNSQAAFNYIQNKRNPSLLDMYVYKIIRETGLGSNDPAVQTMINKIVPWEIRHGQLFDINRFLGDGFDDSSGNNVPDDPLEPAAGETAWLNNPQVPQTFQGVQAWHVNDTDMDGNNTINANDLILQRQLYARHLFCLMMLLMDDGYQASPSGETPPLTQADERELMVRRIAQWAVNVVDFRDADSIMTPFEYDVNPFNGWDVDGNLFTNSSSMPPDGVNPISGQNERRVVWGAEYPDLLIAETKALHNRRVRDTANDTTLEDRDGGDDDLDQLRLPQGSLYLELYCPRKQHNPNDPNRHRLPLELYEPIMANLPGGQQPKWGLALQRVAPPSGDGVSRPVWRLGISVHTPGTPQATNTPLARSATNPHSTSFQPENMSLTQPVTMPGDPPELPLERYVWFSPNLPAGGVEANRTFANTQGWDVHVEPGQYAVVGPRPVTYFGSAVTANPILFTADSPQGIQLQQMDHYVANSTGVVVTDLNGATNPMIIPGATVKSVVGIVADMMPPAGWTDQTRRVGLNITEPLPAIDPYYGEPLFANDAYDDLNAPTNVLPDQPFDQRAGYPLEQYDMLATDTYDNVRAIFLQRLANPLLPWDPIGNPYITVDWSTMDCTVFAGDEDTNRNDAMGNDLDPVDPGPAAAANLRFGTRQRGQDWMQALDANLWKARWPEPEATMPAGLTTTYWDYNFVHSFGYLNSNLGTPLGPPNLGDPNYPFPWLSHLDRPLMSPLELLQVPAWSPGRLTHEFQSLPPPPAPRNFDRYNPTVGNFAPPFAQLLNFFQTGNPSTFPKLAPQLCRLLDYVEVPSAYSGTEKWFNAQVFGNAPQLSSVADTFRPPFNKLSRFRDPGRININTIYDQQVLEAIFSNFPPLNPNPNLNPPNPFLGQAQAFVNRLILSRQGYGPNQLAMDPRYPTRFANPFRTADSADLMPDLTMSGGANLRKAPVEATLLRSTAIDTSTPTDTPLFGYVSTINYNHTDRNPYFHFQAQQKIGNLFTTQSNVFAVWITVGYFEVEDNRDPTTGNIVIDAAHPDGYRLGQEIGADAGSMVRHRFFAIIDRSIPAAYEPGKRHNTDKCVLLRRFIE